MTTYISFCGVFSVPANASELDEKFQNEYDEYSDTDTAFRQGLNYQEIDRENSLSVYLAKIDGKTGHLVADCPAAGWQQETFVYLDRQGNPVKAPENFNPNPVRQLADTDYIQAVPPRRRR